MRVRIGGRLHFGFLNLSLDHDRLYGGIGVGLEAPATVVRADPADTVEADHDRARRYAELTVDRLGVAGAAVTVERTLPRHVGLGSGTRLALAVHAAIAAAHGHEPDLRAAAPELGRGGRSGVGVATAEAGGFVVDAGHPTERFTTAAPDRGEWAVPRVAVRRALPTDWRFVLVEPAAERGRHGVDEARSMRSAIERAGPDRADRIAGVLTRRVLPAIAAEDRAGFGRAVAEIDRLNGAWFADEQGGVYRPPVGTIVDELGAAAGVTGAGQSSWGPTVYGVTDAEHADAARRAGEHALTAAGQEGTVRVVAPATQGLQTAP